MRIIAGLAKGRPIDAVASVTRPTSGEINSVVKDSAQVMAQIEETYGSDDGVEVDHLDGLTVNAKDWWFNVRASNTEPLLRLNVEASKAARMESVRDDVLNIIRGKA